LLSGDFWAQPQTAPTIVLCHGYRTSRAHMRTVAGLQYAHGYNILFFDFRGHGESDSVMTSGGNAEVRDLEAALEVAALQPETLPQKIIIHGFSMGAAVALLTPPRPEVVAIIADSPYAHSDDILRRLVHYELTQGSKHWQAWLRKLQHLWPAVAWLTVFVSSFVFRLRFGYSVMAHPATSFKRWWSRVKVEHEQHRIPILLVHSVGDPLVPINHSRQIAAEAKLYGVPVETYYTEGEEHCGAYGYNPEEYVNVLQNFLARYLHDDFPTVRQKIDENR
jgi:pimeloyl-ACP methyl ester carboxylesterase